MIIIAKSSVKHLCSVFGIILLSCCAPSAGVLSDDPLKPGKNMGQSSKPIPWVGSVVPAAVAVDVAKRREKNRRDLMITGRCVCYGQRTGAIAVPCKDVTVSIISLHGEELARTRTTENFAFEVKPKIAYKLTAYSERYELKNKLRGSYYAGDRVVFSLFEQPNDKW